MSKLDTIARRSAAELLVSVESSPIPWFDPDRIGRYRVGRVVRTVAIALVVLLALLLPALIGQIVEDDLVTPVTTDTTTPEPNDPESLVWPTVVARDFLHRPSGAIGGVPISFPDPMWCGCSLVTLHDGRVLMVGSGHSIGYAAHIWDPDTEQWTATGSPNSVWVPDLKIVLMDDGRVLALLWEQLEVYDPAEGSFRSLTHQSELVPGSVPVVMADGRVLLAASPTRGVVFDPDSERFTSVGSAISGPASVVGVMALTDGRVLILGAAQASVYDPATDGFTAVRPVYPPGPGVALALLDDGRVLLTGGSSWGTGYASLDQASAAAQVFDPTTDRFTAVASMLQPRSRHSAVTIADGRVIVLGGAEALVEVFDPEKGIFEPARELSSPRQGPAVTGLDDGSLLVVGGWRQTLPGWMSTNSDATISRTAEIYNPRFTRREPAMTRLSGFTLGLEVDLPDEQSQWPDGEISLLLVVPPGGLDGATYLDARWELTNRSRTTYDGQGGVAWVGPDGRSWGWAPDTVRPLPVDCEQGCTIRQPLFHGETMGFGLTTLGLKFHVQYEGDIPVQAHGITLTIVDAE
jgi:hypothetical protein